MQSETAFDIDQFDLSFYALKRASAQFSDNVNVPYGNKIYTDMFRINGATKGENKVLTLLGPTLSVSEGEQLTAGKVTAFAEHEFTTVKGYGITGISVAATAFEKAMQSASANDDKAILEKIFAGKDTISLSNSADVMRSYGGADVLKGNGGNDLLVAGGGADNVFGGSGKDRIYGGSGEDIIVGGTGKDWVKGGSGSDKYIYNSKTEAGDTISDFSRTDFIAVKGSKFGGLPKGQLDPDYFAFGSGTGSLDKNTRFIFNVDDDKLWYDSNGTGKSGLTLIADLNIDFLLAWTDIFVI